MVDLRVVVPNRPGTVLSALEAIAQAGVSVEAACGDIRPGERWGYVHVLVADADTARRAMEAAGIEVVSEHEVERHMIGEQPGALVDLLRTFADAGRNLEVMYTSSKGVIVGTEDMLRSRYGVKVEDS
jgi:hypothetical protein